MKRSTPERIAIRDEHPRVADGEDVDFILTATGDRYRLNQVIERRER